MRLSAGHGRSRPEGSKFGPLSPADSELLTVPPWVRATGRPGTAGGPKSGPRRRRPALGIMMIIESRRAGDSDSVPFSIAGVIPADAAAAMTAGGGPHCNFKLSSSGS